MRHPPVGVAVVALTTSVHRDGLSGIAARRESERSPGRRSAPGTADAGSAASGAQSDQTNPRRLFYTRGESILDRLDPTDRHVEIVLDCCPPTTGTIAGLTWLELLTQGSDVVATIRVESITGALNEARDWVRSTVAADVEEVLKSDAPKLSPGVRLSLRYDQGTVTVGGKRITARRLWTVPLEEGKVYLAFFTRVWDGTLSPLEPGSTLTVVAGNYRPLLVESSIAISVPAALEEIAQAATRPTLRFRGRR